MNTATSLTDYEWQSPEFPVCVINVPVSDLSRQLGVPLVFWDEDGLGSTSGFLCKLPSGEVLLVEELAHAREYLGAMGPSIYMEASTLVDLGIECAVNAVLTGLNISSENITWVQTAAGLDAARELADAARNL